ncbi:hypothetical protein JCM3765_002025 [Sporobolomyces pararoseus]
MKSFVLLLDPTSRDLEPSTVSSTSPPTTNDKLQPPQRKEKEQLRHLWNSWNGKASKLLDQESRIENLFWRRWHLEQKQERDMYSSQSFPPQTANPYPASGLQYRTNLPAPLASTSTASTSTSHFDRINEAGRQASRDLEAFLSNTLHNAQPPIIPNPPTFPPAIPPSPYSQLRQNLTNASPSPSVPHSNIVAPQPYRPAPFAQLPQQYQPSPEWAYNALPPVSMPPPLPPSSTGAQNRIIATPSWTALISDSSPQLQSQPHQPAAANYYPPVPPPTANAPQQQPQPPTLPAQPPHFPNSHAHIPTSNPPTSNPPPPPQHNPYSYFSHPHSTGPPLHTPSFTLPPSATLFSDLPSALSSTPALQSAPLSFYSSYGSYQPIITPYPRFLTPSPEPSILGELELELSELDAMNGSNGSISNGQVLDYESVIGANGGSDELRGIEEGDEDGGDKDEDMKSVWREFSENGGGGSASSSYSGPSTSMTTAGGASGFSTSAPTPSGSKKDPFEGMSLAQIRSRANSLEAVDRDAARYEAFGVGSGLEPSDRAAFEVRDMVKKGKGKGKEKESTTTKGGKRKNSRGDGGVIGKKNKNLAPAPPTHHESLLASSPSTIESTSPTLTTASEEASPNFDQNGKIVPSSSGLHKKNRNPHATQLPGNGQRKATKEEAGEGHSGPICSHCQSISTPLWRRGPDDELLCNACGLYLKLHSKPRPKTFGKGAGGTKRALNGAAAKAAASGVPPVCSNCACTSTPMWRVLEGKLSCNACSLYFKLHKVPRPASLAQKRAAAAAAKLDLNPDAPAPSNAPSTVPSPGAERPSILTPSDTSSAPTPGPSSTSASTELKEPKVEEKEPSPMLTSPPTHVAPLQPAVMPPPLHSPSMPPPPMPPTSWAPSIWPAPSASISPFQDSNPFAQTEWGRLAYQLVSAAAEEEAGQTGGGSGSTQA